LGGLSRRPAHQTAAEGGVGTGRWGERVGASGANWERAATRRGGEQRGATDKALNSAGLVDKCFGHGRLVLEQDVTGFGIQYLDE
jgi:hypothetical protein